MKITKPWRDIALQLSGSRVLEIGALDKPFPVNPNNVTFYADREPAERHKEIFKNDKNVKTDKIVDARFLVDDDRYTIKNIDIGTLDLVLSSHVLEHIPNAPRAIMHWLELVKIGGHVFYVIPDKRHSPIDINRPRTPLNYWADKAILKDNESPIHIYQEYFWHVEKSDDSAAIGHSHANQTDIHCWVWDEESHRAQVTWLKDWLKGSFEIVDYQRPDPLNICVLLKRLR